MRCSRGLQREEVSRPGVLYHWGIFSPTSLHSNQTRIVFAQFSSCAYFYYLSYFYWFAYDWLKRFPFGIWSKYLPTRQTLRKPMPPTAGSVLKTFQQLFRILIRFQMSCVQTSLQQKYSLGRLLGQSYTGILRFEIKMEACARKKNTAYLRISFWTIPPDFFNHPCAREVPYAPINSPSARGESPESNLPPSPQEQRANQGNGHARL